MLLRRLTAVHRLCSRSSSPTHRKAQQRVARFSVSSRPRRNMVSSISITFLGTASAVPTAHRNHSALGLKLDADVWLFDCGEATQKQMQQASHGVRMGAIRRIFITHMHGDHVFGIVPLMASVLNGAGGTVDTPDPRLDAVAAATANPDSALPLEIYGPRGLRQYIRTSLVCTYTNLSAPYRVHELLFPGEEASAPAASSLNPAELAGSDVSCSADRLFHDFLSLPDLAVSAGPILHSVPCLGYVVRETRVPGKIDPKLFIPHIQRNKDALVAQGVTRPMSILSRVQTGETVELPDGTVLTPPPERPGRKMVILGDTYDAADVAAIAENADVLVHEATNAHLPPGLDPTTKDSDTEESVEAKARDHGHSTPQVAARFAKSVGARRLLLNHFSNRYKGDDEEASVAIMEGIRQLAVKEFGSEEVVCAKDLMRIEVPRREA